MESHRMLVEAYGEDALGRTACNEWFKKFQSGNFDVRHEKRGRPRKKGEEAKLQALLDQDNTQTLKMLGKVLNVDPATISRRLKAMGMIQKDGKWLPNKLT